MWRAPARVALGFAEALVHMAWNQKTLRSGLLALLLGTRSYDRGEHGLTTNGARTLLLGANLASRRTEQGRYDRKSGQTIGSMGFSRRTPDGRTLEVMVGLKPFRGVLVPFGVKMSSGTLLMVAWSL